MNSSKLVVKFVGWQYPIFMIAVIFLAYKYGKTPSPLISIFTWYWAFYSLYVFLKYKIDIVLRRWIILLIVYFLFTCIGYCYNGVPIMGCYIEFKAFICSMLLVFVGSVNTDKNVYYWFLIAVGLCMIVGLYLYISQPGWYISYKANTLSEAWATEQTITEDNVMHESYRFSSIFPNIYPASYFSVFAYCIIINDLYKTRETRLIQSRILQFILLLVLFVSVLCTMVRVAFLFIILLTFFYYIFGSKNKNKFILLGTFLVILGIFIFILYQIWISSTGGYLLERAFGRLSAVSYDDMMSGSRTAQNMTVLSSWQNYLTGDGFGSRGGYARILGLPGITDGGWTKFLVEYGIIGMFLFLAFIFATYKKALRASRYYMIELSILSYGLIAMIGADTLSKGWMVSIMWIAVGRIWNSNYLYNKINTNDFIK